jgi:hypothetical protein
LKGFASWKVSRRASHCRGGRIIYPLLTSFTPLHSNSKRFQHWWALCKDIQQGMQNDTKTFC